LEKDALSGIFENALDPYGVTLNVGRGYDGWTSIQQAAERYLSCDTECRITVLYFGDFDPSGLDIARSLQDRLAFFDCHPEIVKVALTKEDVVRFNLPPDFTKATDPRRAAFVEKYGDMAVELDALPPDILEKRLVKEVAARMNLQALAEVHEHEKQERQLLISMLDRTRKS
jgi:hypothetical protein